MIATHSVRKAAVFTPCKQYLLKCLFRYIGQPQISRAFTRDSSASVLLCEQNGILRSRPALNRAVNICSWCRKNHTAGIHRRIPQQISSNPRTDLFDSRTNTSHALLQSSWKGSQQNIRSIHVRKSLCAASSKTQNPPNIPLAKSTSFKRIGRKKQVIVTDDALHHQNVVSYAVGEEINLSQLKNEITAKDVYSVVDLPRDITDVLLVTAKYKVNGQTRDAFFFRDGGVAFWHMSESERFDLWHLARSFANIPYDHHLIVEECESLSVIYDSETKLKGDVVHMKIPEEGKSFDEESILHKYTFSNALSQSVNLSMSEANLERFIGQLEPETQKLRCGMKSALKKKDINMKLGEVFQLRHIINLESGYLDHPDIYWEREELEGLYNQMKLYLVIPKRIQVLNERLNYCSEILQLFNSQLNDQHHVRLEWIIIILILIEVMFECIHYVEKYKLIGSKDEGKD